MRVSDAFDERIDYTLDAVGNLTSQSGGTTNLAETYGYAANSNQLESIVNGTTTRSFAYSATGALANDSRSGTSLSFEYGEDDRPDQVASPVQVLAMYDHDFLGRRVMKDVTGTSKNQHKINKHPKKKTLPAVITHFLYDRAGRLLAEPDAGTGATGTEYIRLGDMPVGLVSSGTLYFVHPDHLGTPQKITDATQAIAFDLVLRPFGQAEQQTFPPLSNLRFPGQYFDVESGLHQNWFRDYDPSVGRYIESDPIGLGGGANTYSYADETPIDKTDLNGLLALAGIMQAPPEPMTPIPMRNKPVQQCLSPGPGGGGGTNEMCPLMPRIEQFGMCLYVCPSGGIIRGYMSVFGNCPPYRFKHQGLGPGE